MIYRTLTVYGLGTGSLFAGLAYSLTNQVTDVDGTLQIVERLGIPALFLLGLLAMIWRGAKAIAPFLRDQVLTLTSIPTEQMRLEREERLTKQSRFEEITIRLSEDHNKTLREISKQNMESQSKLAEAIMELSKKFEIALNGKKSE